MWEEIAELRLQQESNIDLIKAELQGMTDSCNVQKNVNMTIKEGLKKIGQLDRKLQEDCEDLRQDRTKTERLQAQVMWNVVLASKEATKRKRPSPEESSPENRPFKKAVHENM